MAASPNQIPATALPPALPPTEHFVADLDVAPAPLVRSVLEAAAGV